MKIISQVLFLLLFSASISAQEPQYYPVTFQNIGKTYWKIGALDISRNQDLDAHMRLYHCGIFQNYYTDDFSWRNIRNAVFHEIKRNKRTYPSFYEFHAPINLDRYDFDAQQFLLSKETMLQQVNILPLVNNESFKPYCGLEKSVKQFPDYATISFKKSFDFLAVPMEEKQAENLIARFKEEKNAERLVFMKIKFQVSDFDLVKEAIGSNSIQLYGHFKKVEVFLDKESQNLIYEAKIK